MPVIRRGRDGVDPAGPGQGRRLWWWRGVALLGAVIVVAGTVAIVTSQGQHTPPLPAKTAPSGGPACPGLAATSGDGFALASVPIKQGPEANAPSAMECVGWIIERDYPFGSGDAAVKAIISKIVAENRRVAQPDGTGPARPYVRIGVLMPMTDTPTGAMGPSEILHSLEGAYAAQWQANHGVGTDFGDPTPQFQLVLGNEGSNKSAWSAAADGLTALRDGEHPLVAVTGLGISVPETRNAAVALDRARIPTIGAVITSDDMVAPSMFKVSPSNHQYAAALKAYLDARRKARTGDPLTKGYLIWDRNDDNFVATLKTALTDTFDEQFGLSQHNRAFTGSKKPNRGTPQLFADIVRDICTAKPDIVFYAGRDRDLDALVKALKGRETCQNPTKPILIATGATGITVDPALLDQAQIGLLDASCTDVAGWRANAPGTPAHYKSFEAVFTAPAPGGLGFAPGDLDDGYAVLHRDAVAAAVSATRHDAAAKTDAAQGGGGASPLPPGPVDTRNALFGNADNAIPGASGDIFFSELPAGGRANELWPSRKPVPILRFGALVAGWPAGDTYYTP
ncbi:ABC transporter substrate-binding protein [Dactylosporangium vinaceum]|uniref:ABC transporter substrate-binding protein n=1 Tax=Dactylosporangium vinaceum TaxID=53362 RepID=A0ABV5ME62_9ACTN|nr:hypothetical protein [Dactylosporangium vinaceum]UAB92494.1 ABC transporter substrate-binding protein [Dactylosporangium vinaceum]